MYQDMHQAMFQAVRTSQPGFDAEELAAVAEVGLPEAEAYLEFLQSAGFVRRHGSGRYAATSLARDTLAAPTPDGLEIVDLRLALDKAAGQTRMLTESSPGAWERVLQTVGRAAPAQQPQKFLRDTMPDSGRDRMWRALHELRCCTWGELSQASGCSRWATKDYLRLLQLAGLVTRTLRQSEQALYELSPNAGPTRPVIRETLRRSRGKGGKV